MRWMPRLLYILKPLWIVSFTPLPIFGAWYDQKLEGWYYFQDQKTAQEELAAPKSVNKSLNKSLKEADLYLQAESYKLKQLLSLAIVSPTSENVENYMRAQQRWIEQSGRFAKMWGKVLLEHPELSDLLSTPTSTYGALAKRELDIKKRGEFLQSLSKDHFLLFFFKGSDPYSKKAAEVAQLFASTHHWKLKAVSMDNLGTLELTSFETDQGLSAHFGVRVTPSFYTVNPTDNQVFPVGIGMISVSELEENIEKQLKGPRDDD